MKVTSWYAEITTPSLDIQQFVADQMLTDLPKELFYERSVFRKSINDPGSWTFEVKIESGEIEPPWVAVGFMHGKKNIHGCMIFPHLIGYQCHRLFVNLDEINVLIII